MPRVVVVGGSCVTAFAAVLGLSAVLSTTAGRSRRAAGAASRQPAQVAGRGASAGDVLETTLHAAHVGGVEPIACTGCHTVGADTYQAPDPARCLSCHPALRTGVHAAVADAPACTRCHDFLDRGKPLDRAWQCGACH
jgi:hypothetical protein